MTADVPRTDPRCPSCPHPLSEHDAIARRYCAATQAGQAADRGCVCSTVQGHTNAAEKQTRTHR
ncbi:RGCVC family protein [Amycolatopsis sp. MtRt-6]|uniref:RGCVC family protein n=1 Tax=Amycolatopsis sp. MtRt-6 TaxID=2792782 RepID=UPI001A8FEF5B|nr:RGCVC family protein [Amycolatopsis sp. MtRt-6]